MMVDIEYIGHKPVKTDNVSGSGAVWTGAGGIQQVTQEQADKLLKFPGVWRLAGEATLHVNDPKIVVQVDDDQLGAELAADGNAEDASPANDKAALLSVARGMGIDVDGRSSRDKITALIEQRRAELAASADQQKGE